MSDHGQKIITYGDLHADIAAFLMHLYKMKLIENPPGKDIVNKLLDLICEDPTIPQVIEFSNLVKELKFNELFKYRLLGDVFAGPGPNDVFTLLFIKQLQERQLIHSWVLSNHDCEAAYMLYAPYRFEDFNQWHFNSFIKFLHSLGKLQEEHYDYLAADLIEILKTSYTSMKVLDFAETTLDDGTPQLNIYSHAPLSKQDFISAIEELSLNYQPPCAIEGIFNSKQTLCKTISFINNLFQSAKEKYHLIYEILDSHNTHHKCSILRFFYKRDNERELYHDELTSHEHPYNLSCNDGTKVINIHGHDGFPKDRFHHQELKNFRESLNTLPLVPLDGTWDQEIISTDKIIFTYTGKFMTEIVIHKKEDHYTSKVSLDSKLLYSTEMSIEDFQIVQTEFAKNNHLFNYRHLFTLANKIHQETPVLLVKQATEATTIDMSPILSMTPHFYRLKEADCKTFPFADDDDEDYYYNPQPSLKPGT